MLLAVGRGRIGQAGVVQPRRVAQNRLGHADIMIGGEVAHHARRRVRDAAEPARELGARVLLDRRGEPLQQVVEQRDVIVGEIVRARDEQIGDAPKRGRTLLFRPGGERVFDFVDQTAWRRHNRRHSLGWPAAAPDRIAQPRNKE